MSAVLAFVVVDGLRAQPVFSVWQVESLEVRIERKAGLQGIGIAKLDQELVFLLHGLLV